MAYSIIQHNLWQIVNFMENNRCLLKRSLFIFKHSKNYITDYEVKSSECLIRTGQEA